MNWIEKNRRMLTFFVIVLASITLNLLLNRCSHVSYVDSHNMIIAQYKDHITKADQKLNGLIKYVPTATPTKTDSLYANLQMQYQKSLEQQKLFQESVKSMMELEFTKIQNEYENQEIWIGLITIVFLIFSFYSMMKSEQFEQQCREDAKTVHDWMESCKGILKSIEDEKVEKLKGISNGFRDWKIAKDNDMKTQTANLVNAELKSFREEKDIKINEITKKWNDTVDDKVRQVFGDIKNIEEAVKLEIDEIKKSSSKECSENVKTLLTMTELKLNAEIKRLLEDAESNVSRLIDKRIADDIEEHTVMEEDINQMFDQSFETGGTMTDASSDNTEKKSSTDNSQDNE